jgi:hypothetical protein
MKRASAALCAPILATLSAVHFAWAAGWERFAAGAVPSKPVIGDAQAAVPLFEPSPLTTVAVGVGLAAAAAVVLRAGFSGRGRLLTMAVSWLFGARAFGDSRYIGFSKRVRGTDFARKDYLLYSPLCVVVSLLAGRAAR